jgi:CubicO group peptidase (beta-lactamase class C family)
MGILMISGVDFLNGALISDYVWPVGRTPAYSNYAFVILGYAIESFTGKSLQSVIEDDIAKPLGLSSATGMQSQDPALMVIPGEVDHFGTTDIGEWNGCVYTRPSDASHEQSMPFTQAPSLRRYQYADFVITGPLECLRLPTTLLGSCVDY